MKRSPAAAFWLSLLPGLGHLYLGLMTKGFVFALLAVGLIDVVDRGADAFGIMVPIFWLFVMLDAHRSAQAINRGDATGEAILKSGSKWWGGTLIVLGVLFLLYNFDLFEFDWLWQFWPVALIVVGIRLVKPSFFGMEPASAPAAPPPPEPRSISEPLDDAPMFSNDRTGEQPEESMNEPEESRESSNGGEDHDRTADG
jgi:hypothetical protein